MRMPFRQHEPSRGERMRCAVQNRAAGAAHTLSGAAGTAAVTAQGAAVTAACAAQDAAHVVADRATVAAHGVADRAGTAAGAVAERARPLAAEAADRGSAAWHIIRYGAPRPSPLTRVTSFVPVTTVTTVARRSKAPMALMALGAAAGVCVMWLRRARMDRDSVWILDEDSDSEPVGRWQEGDSRNAVDHSDRGRDSSHASSGRKDSPANRWP